VHPGDTANQISRMISEAGDADGLLITDD
jgi:hypothetical protein